jgi:endonuclease YncB( thermonuclease family)
MQKLVKKVGIWLSISILVLGLGSCDRFFPTGDLVERVSDGDTLAVKDAKGNKFNVRFACMDAPEVPHSKKERESRRSSDRNQFSWGAKAQERLQELIQKSGDRVTLNITDSDRYGRKVAEVRLKDGTLVQEVLLREGLAKVYRPYLNKCPSKELVQQAEAQAQQQKIGIWGDEKFTNPWEYRSFNKRNL